MGGSGNPMRRLIRLGVAALLLPTMILAAPMAPQGEKRHALVVGNANYQTVPALDNSVNDSRDICLALKKVGFQATCVTDVATRGQFKDLVNKFVQGVKKGDVILFYYAGHGVEMDGENYLVPTRAEFRSRGSFEDDAIRVNYILEELEATGSRLSVVILDACRDNPFGGRSRSAIGRGLAIPDRAPAGSIIIFPTSPGRVALDSGSDSRNGLFTKHLLRHLTSPGLEVEDMFKRVIDGVRTESEGMGAPQIPWMNLSFTGEFCFAGCVDKAAAEREREQLALRARELEAQLSVQQKQSEEFRLRMKEMETRLANRQQTLPQDTPEFKRLQAERAELAKKVAMLESQDQGLRKAQQSLTAYRRSRSDLDRLDQELTVQKGRLQELERQLRTSRSTGAGNAENLVDLRKERDDVRNRIQELVAEKKQLESAAKDVASAAEVAQQSERYNKELAVYRDRLAVLERDASEREKQLEAERARRLATEEKLKDANRATVRGAAIVAPAF